MEYFVGYGLLVDSVINVVEVNVVLVVRFYDLVLFDFGLFDVDGVELVC